MQHCNDMAGLAQIFSLIFGAIGLTLGWLIWGYK